MPTIVKQGIDERVFQNNNLHRSSEVKMLISNKPNFIIRWGITLLFIAVASIVVICWFIRYPDVVPANAKLTSINAPKPVISLSGGKVVRLLVKEEQSVKMGDAIGYMESLPSQAVVLTLQEQLKNLHHVLDDELGENAPLHPSWGSLASGGLGELQQPYQTFTTAYISFTNYLKNGFYIKKKSLLLADLRYLQDLFENLEQQKKLQTEDLQLAEKTFAANESLKADKVISEFDYRNEKSKLIGKKMTVPQIDASIISNQSQQNDKRKEILELESQIAQQKSIFIQALSTLESQVDEWCRKYILKAPVDGKVSFVSFLQENQQLQANQVVCYINPANSTYYAEMTIPQANFGKIVVGQKVLLKFAAYPFQEFGAVQGVIEFISRQPSDSGYAAKVALPNGLITNYKKSVQYREGLKAQGEIITKDTRLLQRFYYNVVGQIRQ